MFGILVLLQISFYNALV